MFEETGPGLEAVKQTTAPTPLFFVSFFSCTDKITETGQRKKKNAKRKKLRKENKEAVQKVHRLCGRPEEAML